VWSWLGTVISAAIILLIGGYARKIVRKNAPFYAKPNILIVGSAYGVMVEGVMHVYTKCMVIQYQLLCSLYYRVSYRHCT
jgi:hypothetical protein